MTAYRPGYVEPSLSEQAREDRPNPRWPQRAEVEALVARVRSLIAAAPEALQNTRSPVAEIVLKVTDDVWLATEVIEGVLADSASRFMLNAAGLHPGGTATKRRGKR